jgi:hypothetical protein
VFNVRVEAIEKEEKISQVVFKSDVDVSGTELESDSDIILKERDGLMVPTLEMNDIIMSVHTLGNFSEMLQGVFGDEAEHRLLADFREEWSEDFVPNYWVHVIVKT